MQKNSFFLNVASVATGAAASQAVALLALPILTRLYSPAQFGVLGVYAGILAVLSVVVCLRFENAIPLPKTDRAASHVAFLALLVAVLIAALTGISLMVFRGLLSFNNSEMGEAYFSLLLVAGVFGSGLYQIGNYWSVRSRRFDVIGKTRFQQTVVGCIAQLSFGYMGFGAIGLIVGQLLSQVSGFVSLGWDVFFKIKKNKYIYFKRKYISWVFERFKRFPFFDTPAAILNATSSQAPLILFAALFSPELAGFYALSTKVLSAPLSLIGSSISQVLIPRIVEGRANGEASKTMYKTFRALASISALPFAVFFVVAPTVFSSLFGHVWRDAGTVAAWTALWVAFQFVYAPISVYLLCVEAQFLNMCIQAVLFALRLGALALSFYIGQGVDPVVVYSIVSIFCYLMALIVLLRFSGVSVILVLRAILVESGIGASFAIIVWFFWERGVTQVALVLLLTVVFYVARLLVMKRELLGR